jgi:hypothetical protein
MLFLSYICQLLGALLDNRIAILCAALSLFQYFFFTVMVTHKIQYYVYCDKGRH